MPFLNLLQHLAEALRHRLCNFHSFTIAGGSEILQHLADPMVAALRTNPVVPGSDAEHKSDFLVYAAGNVYVVKVNNLAGRVRYADGERRMIIQEKVGTDGQVLHQKISPNPWLQARSFLDSLRGFLATEVDQRFEQLRFFPVAAYGDPCDASGIYEFDSGVIPVTGIPLFFRSNANLKSAADKQSWVVDAFRRVPSCDRLVTTDGNEFRGRFADACLRFRPVTGGRSELPLVTIRLVRLSRARASDHDTLTVWFRAGWLQQFRAAAGIIEIRRSNGELVTQELRNVAEIRPADPKGALAPSMAVDIT